MNSIQPTIWLPVALSVVIGGGSVAALAAPPTQESAASAHVAATNGGAAPIATATEKDTVPGTSASASAPEPVLPLTPDQIAGHLGETVDWYHHLEPIEQLQVAADDAASRERLHQQSITAVQLAFDFGKACAALLDAQPKQPSATDTSAPAKGLAARLDQAAAGLGQRVAGLTAQLAALDAQLPGARGQERTTLVAQRGQVAAALDLARQVQTSVADMEKFEASTLEGDNNNLSALSGQIADMERSVPEAHRVVTARGSAGAGGSRKNANSTAGAGTAGGDGTLGGTSGATTSGMTVAGISLVAPATPSAHSSANSATFRPESAGVIALVSEWFSLQGMRQQLRDSVKETDALLAELEKVRATLTTEVRKIVSAGFGMNLSTDPVQLLAQRQTLEAGTARFKLLSTVLVPLGEQGLIVESARNTIDDWRDTLDTRMASIARYLALRVGLLLGWIAAVLIVSEIWRRATFRYLHDLRRRRQFLVLRRVAVGIALTLVIVFGLVSEISSIATYIGFVTAGVAVALQNVILAVVAYFFLIGRFGVRVGDRITLAAVTGRVVDIGLVRIYLMELSGPDLRSTGRMVVLSNAVMFQPTALFKQIPGADYVWHTVTLTIAATADVMEAHKRLQAAADAVYETYRAVIERQHAMVQRFIDFDASSPRPEVRVRLTENGLECGVRYPVELESSAVVDQQMLKALRDALEQDPQLKLVASGAVVLKSSDS